MKRPLRRLTYLTWGVTLLVLGALLWLSFQEPRGPSRRLPDGTKLELAAVTYGRDHRYLPGNLWERLLRSGDGGSLHTRQEEPVLWLRWLRGPSANPPARAWPAFTIDEHGCRFPNNETAVCPPWTFIFFSRAPGLARELTSLELPVYPRRSPGFRFALLDLAGPDYGIAAEYPLSAPTAGPFPEWHGNRPPLVATSGGTKFVLRRFRHTRDVYGIGTATAAFACRERGKAAPNWTPEEITLSDATGNSLSVRYPHGEATPYAELPTLCPREPAWKLRVRFVRPEPDKAVPAYRWSVSLPAPARNRGIASQARTHLGRVALEVTHLLGGGTEQWEGDLNTHATPSVHLRATAPDSHFTLALAHAETASGRELPLPPHTFQSLKSGTVDGELDLSYPPGTKQLHLTFGLYETHTVEFLVKPN